uniref:Uncharacterized protein n=1 Tax=Strigamia maritima TaxID=126957 RepID=T1IXQ2_STRMM
MIRYLFILVGSDKLYYDLLYCSFSNVIKICQFCCRYSLGTLPLPNFKLWLMSTLKTHLMDKMNDLVKVDQNDEQRSGS